MRKLNISEKVALKEVLRTVKFIDAVEIGGIARILSVSPEHIRDKLKHLQEPWSNETAHVSCRYILKQLNVDTFIKEPAERKVVVVKNIVSGFIIHDHNRQSTKLPPMTVPATRGITPSIVTYDRQVPS